VLFQEAGIKLGSVALTLAMGGGNEATKITVAGLIFSEEGDVTSTGESYLGTNDALNSDRLRKMSEAHGPAEVIVVGERQSMVAQFFRPEKKLFQRRGAVMEGIVTVAMEFSVRHIALSKSAGTSN
jgi:hypothetical protein